MSFVARRAITTGQHCARLRPNTFNRGSKRFTSQNSSQPGGISSHILAGVFGGFAVLGAGYAYYHFSGVKRAVDASKRAKVYLQETKESVSKKYAGVVSGSLKRARSVIKEKRSKWRPRKDASKDSSDEKTTDP